MKKLIFGILLFISSLICGNILLVITIYREVETYVKTFMFFYFLLSIIGLAISAYECYRKNDKEKTK